MAVQPKINDLNHMRASDRVWVIHTLPALMVLLSVLLVFGLTLLVLSIVEGLHLGSLLVHPDPFAAYGTIWPGEPISGVAQYAQRTPSGSMPCYSGVALPEAQLGLQVFVASPAYGGQDRKLVCMDTPQDGVFYSMSVTLNDNQVQELNLFSDVLLADSLLLYWGAPDEMTPGASGQFRYLDWDRSTYSATAMIAQPGTVVRLVTLRAKP